MNDMYIYDYEIEEVMKQLGVNKRALCAFLDPDAKEPEKHLQSLFYRKNGKTKVLPMRKGQETYSKKLYDLIQEVLYPVESTTLVYKKPGDVSDFTKIDMEAGGCGPTDEIVVTEPDTKHGRYPFPERAFLKPTPKDVKCSILNGKFTIEFTEDASKRIGHRDGFLLASHHGKLYFVKSFGNIVDCKRNIKEYPEGTIVCERNSICVDDPDMVDILVRYCGSYKLQWDEEYDIFYIEKPKTTLEGNEDE